MNPQSNNERSSVNLPPPVAEQSVPQAVNNQEKPAQNVAEHAEAMPHPSAAPATLPSLPAVPPASQSFVQPNPSSVASSTTNSVVNTTADDSDLIEKEWVNRAKKIIEDNRDNPHKQSKELTIVKADYMKKRYNKTIKLSE